ncbi:MAG: NUDIX hydrolase [Eubacteriales bacterium]|nr:NUDIX hydrolase [Eubacteriales bacterium]
MKDMNSDDLLNRNPEISVDSRDIRNDVEIEAKLQEPFAEQVVSSEAIFFGQVFQVEKLQVTVEHGEDQSRELVRHSGGACILAVDRDGRIVFEKQYRVAAGQALYELPAGKIEPGEDPLVCAKRELEEETAYRGKHWELLSAHYPTPGYCTERIYVYLATDLEPGVRNLDPHEDVTVFSLSLEEAIHWIRTGKIIDAKTIIGVLTYALKLRQLDA